MQSKLHDVKRELILDTASELLETLGYDKLKVSELASEVGVSVGSIYSMFDSKEGLYLAYVQRQVDRFLSILEEKLVGVNDPKEMLLSTLSLKLEYFNQKKKAIEDCAKNNVFFFNNINTGTEILEEIFIFLARIIEKINTKLQANEAEKLAYVIMGLSDGYINHWLKREDDLSSELSALHKQSLYIIQEYK